MQQNSSNNAIHVNELQNHKNGIGNIASQPFEKWGIDFVGLISLVTRSTQARYIILAMDYFTKQDEAKATQKVDTRSITKFLYEHVISQFGCSLELISPSDLSNPSFSGVSFVFCAHFLIFWRIWMRY